MPDYAVNYTSRSILRYRSHTANHQLMLRFGSTGTNAIAQAKSGEFLAALKPYVVAHGPVDFAWLDATFTPANSDFGFAMPLPAIAATSWAGPVAATRQYTAKETSWEARGEAGSLYSFSVFGLLNVWGEDNGSPFRINRPEDPTLGTLLDALAAIEGITAIDNTPLVWKQYANYGDNAYWKRKVRMG